MLRLVLVKEVYFKMNYDLSMIYDILNEIALYLKDDTDKSSIYVVGFAQLWHT